MKCFKFYRWKSTVFASCLCANLRNGFIRKVILVELSSMTYLRNKKYYLVYLKINCGRQKGTKVKTLLQSCSICQECIEKITSQRLSSVMGGPSLATSS